MDEEKLIQVSFQIPPSALDSLARLAEQLRLLTETVHSSELPVSRRAETEHIESGSFDPKRFLALQRDAELQARSVEAEVSEIGSAQTVSAVVSPVEDARSVSAAVSPVEDARSVSAAVSSPEDARSASAAVSPVKDARSVSATVSPVEDARSTSATVSSPEDARSVSAAVSPVEDASSVSADVQKTLQDAKSAGSTLLQHSEHSERRMDAEAAGTPQQTLSGRRDDPPPPAKRVQSERTESIPAVRAEAEGAVPDAPEARREVSRQIQGVESVRAEAEAREMALAEVRGEVSGAIEAPLGAGVVVQTTPETPQSRWTGVTEELVVPGPAPLTAEAVSLAFERDGRRYDNGFPLY